MTLRSPDVLAQAREADELARAGEPGAIAAERRHALNWLCGDGADWDNA